MTVSFMLAASWKRTQSFYQMAALGQEPSVMSSMCPERADGRRLPQDKQTRTKAAAPGSGEGRVPGRPIMGLLGTF